MRKISEMFEIHKKFTLFLPMKQVKYLLLKNDLNNAKSWNATNNYPAEFINQI